MSSGDHGGKRHRARNVQQRDYEQDQSAQGRQLGKIDVRQLERKRTQDEVILATREQRIPLKCHQSCDSQNGHYDEEKLIGINRPTIEVGVRSEGEKFVFFVVKL